MTTGISGSLRYKMPKGHKDEVTDAQIKERRKALRVEINALAEYPLKKLALTNFAGRAVKAAKLTGAALSVYVNNELLMDVDASKDDAFMVLADSLIEKLDIDKTAEMKVSGELVAVAVATN